MDPKDYSGRPIHYSGKWGQVAWTDGKYDPGQVFRLYLATPKVLVLKGTKMNNGDAFAVTLNEGYHNFMCDMIIETGSDADVSDVIALF